MRLLLDENLSHRLVQRLRTVFPGTTHVRDVGLRGKPDLAIWNYAARHNYIVVSKDDDFRQLSLFHGHPPKAVWLVVGNAGTDPIADLLLQNEALITAFVEQTEDALLTLRSGNVDPD